MVEKISLFELHFDGATFGPTSSAESPSEGTVAEEEIPAAEAAAKSGGGRGRKVVGLVVASIVVSVVVSAIARRLVGDDGFEAIDVDGDEDENPIEVVEE